MYIALLRGINVGGNKKVDMKTVCKLFEKLGFTKVKSYINSGNIIFESNINSTSKLKELIEKELQNVFHFEVLCIVVGSEVIKNICEKVNPKWVNDDKQKTDVLFLWDKYDNKKSLELVNITKDIDQLIYLKGAIIWHIDRQFYNKSGMNKFIGTTLYKNMTARNINTVRKLNLLSENKV